jgi:xylulokinase
MTGRYSLGLEFSTQSVKMVVIDVEDQAVIYTGKFDYDTALPKYKTQGGVIPSRRSDRRHTSPAMITESVDLAFQKLKDDGIEMDLIGCVKLDAQQHCTVYTDAGFASLVTSLSSRQSLVNQVRRHFSRKTSPIWEDRSPRSEIQDLTKALKKKGGIENLTGNPAEPRFPAPQILHWARRSRPEYENTAHIFVLSSFLTSLLIGHVAPVDTGDGWGTNLNNLDVNNPGWSDEVIEVMNKFLEDLGTLGMLERRIGEIDPYDTDMAYINPYYIQKYGVNPDALVLAGTGDNPATLLGTGGKITISLGSSYTVNGVMAEITPSQTGEYNIFGYIPGQAMALSVFTNGAKLHDEFIRRYVKDGDESSPITDEDWEKYMELAGEPNPTPDEPLMLPYLYSESVPRAKAGIIRDGFAEDDARANIRALHFSQALFLKLHSSHLQNVESISVVGGAARNPFLRQAITDVFGAETYLIENADYAAPLGCAVSGARKLLGSTYEEATQMFVLREPAGTMTPRQENRATYDGLLNRYRELEEKHVKKG